MPEMITVNVQDVVWREDLYPRFEPNPQVIQQYAESLEHLPPIELNQHNELIDGYHRWTAHRKAGVETMHAVITPTKSDKEFLRLAIERNAKHGLQLSNAEKQAVVLQLYTGAAGEKEDLARLCAVSARTIARWTARRDKDLKAQRDKEIADLWLACYTRDEIAQLADVSTGYVSELTKKPSEIDIWQKMTVLSNYQELDWQPPLYAVWKAKEKSNGVHHFGNSEASFVDNLLYMYTAPFAVVVDPCAGGGSTIDVCKKRLRRYWVSDRLPIVERRDIRQHDILEGAPPLHKRWGEVELLYLDPPYWQQAAGQYSTDAADLANMELEDFYAAVVRFIADCSEKMPAGARVALMMQATQWKAPRRRVIDHAVDLITRLGGYSHLRYERRITCPYESQQCTAQQVAWAKAQREVLVTNRELVIWEVVA